MMARDQRPVVVWAGYTDSMRSDTWRLARILASLHDRLCRFFRGCPQQSAKEAPPTAGQLGTSTTWKTPQTRDSLARYGLAPYAP